MTEKIMIEKEKKMFEDLYYKECAKIGLLQTKIEYLKKEIEYLRVRNSYLMNYNEVID